MKFYKYSTGDFVMRHKIIERSRLVGLSILDKMGKLITPI